MLQDSEHVGQMLNILLLVSSDCRSPYQQSPQNGGSARVLPTFPVAQRHGVDRRNLEAGLPPVRCD